MSQPAVSPRALAWLVHLFTASGAAVGLLALERAISQDFVWTFVWLAVALVIDGIDGTLARAFGVRESLPYVDGDLLDLVVDFLTYVIVPMVAFVHAGLMAREFALTLAAIVVTASALYFADTRMKTEDNWFRGFPTLWNVLVFYLLVFRPSPALTAGIVIIAGIAMFLPIVFVHPMRVARLKWLTGAVLAVWTCSVGAELWTGFAGPGWSRAVLLITAAYIVLLPLARGSIWAAKAR
ncbi:phosphatidylcholine synthase [Roseiarcaceae bacterium H3SJ34-1]|uniref:CDP-alcohol phosphatidyltransferase family protein n=1 Tax=Terripilifer ovatus TaxID=3032367 RepID=UPI003AB981BB|nr:phosphatidylcholine synthase [Roseiarcaceae bacterium H3SJ34-1]